VLSSFNQYINQGGLVIFKKTYNSIYSATKEEILIDKRSYFASS